MKKKLFAGIVAVALISFGTFGSVSADGSSLISSCGYYPGEDHVPCML